MKAHLNINNSLFIAEKKEQEDQQNLSKMRKSNTRNRVYSLYNQAKKL